MGSGALSLRKGTRGPDVRCYLSSGTSVPVAKPWPSVLEHGYGEQDIQTESSDIG